MSCHTVTLNIILSEVAAVGGHAEMNVQSQSFYILLALPVNIIAHAAMNLHNRK